MSTKVYRFRMYITPRECQEYYKGLFTSIQVLTHTGQTLQLPARHIRNFMTPSGVEGLFELHLDNNNKFISLQKIAN